MVRRCGARLCLLLLFLGPVNLLRGLDPSKNIGQYSHEDWTSQHGLPGRAVYQILQSRDGYLWLRTSVGLVRFDGVRFTPMDKDIGSGPVRAIAMSADGDLLIRSDGKTLTYKNGIFSDYLPPRPLPDGGIKALFESSSHELLLGSDDFIYLLQKDGIRRLLRGTGYVEAFAQEDDGKVWIGGAKALYSYQAGTLSTFIESKDWRSSISTLYVDRQNTLWVGTSEGLYRRKSGETALQPVAPRVIEGKIHALLEDRQGSLWVATDQLGLIRLRDGQISSFTTADGLTKNHVLSLLEDKEGSIWVGTAGGLDRFHDTKVTTLTMQEGLPSDDVRAVFQTRNGNVYAFCIPGGLALIQNGRASLVTKNKGLNFQGGGIFESKDGSLWVGTVTGLARLKNGKFTVYDPDGHFSKHFISSISEDDESLIVTTSETIAERFQEGKVLPYTIHGQTTPLTAPGNYTFSIYRDPAGTLWFGTVKGLFKFARGEPPMDARQSQIDFPVTSISDGHQGSLWLGGRTPGLTRLRLRDGRVTHYGQKDGLFDDMVTSVLADDAGNLWISTSSGIYIVKRTDMDAFAEGRLATVPSTVYGTNDGMKTNEANLSNSQPGGWRTHDGRLWFTTTEGLVVIDPKHIRHNDLIPPVAIENIVVNGRSTSPRSSLQVPPGNGTIEVQYTSTSLFIPDRMRFRYRLFGYDHDWVDAGTRRVAYYTNLPPGKYRFQVIAANDDGVWNTTGASVSFVLKPHFYQTGWFLVLSILFGIAIAIAGQRIYTRRLRARAEALESIVDQRTADLQSEIVVRQRAEKTAEGASHAKSMFLANMSHELRTPLNAILGYAQLIRQDRTLSQLQSDAAKTIQQSGAHLLSLINDILDLSKIEADKVELHLDTVYLAGFLHDIANTIRIKADEKVLAFVCHCSPGLPTAVRADEKRLRQVLLNLLSNAVKFTDHGRVDLQVTLLSQSSDQVRLRFAVRDTGTGIATNDLDKIFKPFEQVGDQQHSAGGTGLGLGISQQLVRLMQSEIQVESSVGQGSSFSFDLTTQLVQPAQIPAQSSRQVIAYQGPRKRILIVDDIPASRSVLSDTLATLGFEVSQAVNGLEAVAKAIQDASPDLILMKVGMLVMDGLEAIRQIRQIPTLSPLPIIAVTAGDDEEQQASCRTAGANSFLTEPIEHDLLLEEVGRLLALTWIHEEALPTPTVPDHQGADHFIVPGSDHMEVLLALAKAGNMRSIREKADQLATLDLQYRPFADRITAMALAYQSKALLRFVERHAASR